MAIRGFLRVVVLKALTSEAKTGYSLMKDIQNTIGHKPSTGSMYPLLESLLLEKLVSVKEKGRGKQYTITAKGKKQLNKIEDVRRTCFEGMLEKIKLMEQITGEDMTFPKTMINHVKRGKMPFKEINPEWCKLREQLLKSLTDGNLKKESNKIKKALAKAIKEIKSK